MIELNGSKKEVVYKGQDKMRIETNYIIIDKFVLELETKIAAYSYIIYLHIIYY